MVGLLRPITSLERRAAGFILLTVMFSMGVAPMTALAQPSKLVKLSDLLDEALKNNPDLLSAKLRWEAIREDIPQARSLDDPELSIARRGIPSDFNFGNADETSYGIEQSFPFPGKRALRGKMAAQVSAAAEQDYLARMREVTARVKIAYDDLFLVQKSIDLSLEHRTLLEGFLEIADRKYAVGQVSQQDLLKAQVELSKIHNRLLLLEQEGVSARAEIRSLLNLPQDTEVGRVEDLEFRPFTFTLEEVMEQALQKRPELRAARFMIEKSKQATVLAKRDYLPDVRVEVSYSEFQAGPNHWMATGKINLPWIFKGKYDARVRQSAAEEAKARADQAAVRNQTLSGVRDHFTMVKTTEQLIGIYRDGVLPQAEQSLEASRIGYQAGKVDFLNLIDSERTLRDLQLEYYAALARFWRSIAELERMAGVDLNPS